MLRVVFASLSTLLLLAILLPIQPATQAQAQGSDVEYYAVIVGVADYQNLDPAPSSPLPGEAYDLPYSDDDAQDLYDELCSLWGSDHIKLLVDSEATKANIGDSVVSWLDPREDANDVVFFFFGGHSRQDYYGQEYLCPYESSEYFCTYDIKDSELNGWLSYLESGKVVIMLDTCDSAGFFGELGQSGRVILAGCGGDEVSWQYPSLGHSVFAYYLLNAFDNLEAVDTNDNRKISAEELFYYARPKVISYTDDDQHP